MDLDRDVFAERLRINLEERTVNLIKLYDAVLSFDDIFEEYYEYGQQIAGSCNRYFCYS